MKYYTWKLYSGDKLIHVLIKEAYFSYLLLKQLSEYSHTLLQYLLVI